MRLRWNGLHSGVEPMTPFVIALWILSVGLMRASLMWAVADYRTACTLDRARRIRRMKLEVNR